MLTKCSVFQEDVERTKHISPENLMLLSIRRRLSAGVVVNGGGR